MVQLQHKYYTFSIKKLSKQIPYEIYQYMKVEKLIILIEKIHQQYLSILFCCKFLNGAAYLQTLNDTRGLNEVLLK